METTSDSPRRHLHVIGPMHYSIVFSKAFVYAAQKIAKG